MSIQEKKVTKSDLSDWMAALHSEQIFFPNFYLFREAKNILLINLERIVEKIPFSFYIINFLFYFIVSIDKNSRQILSVC